MNTVVKVLLFFIVISIGSSVLINTFNVTFGAADFWNYHGFFFLILIAFFPRLTLLFSSVPFGGLFWWLGWVFAPRLLVALLATINYWHSNKLLVVFAWMVCIGGESSEKTAIHKKTKKRYAGKTIDAEYTDLGN